MPNDAKLGLFFGVGLVITVAVLFFRKDLPGGLNLAAGNSPGWTLQGKPVTNPKSNARTVSGGRRHVVQDGDTLVNIAQKYYGDTEQFKTILNVNRDQINAPDRLTPGTVLVIPDQPQK